MKRTGRIPFDPIAAAERAERRAARRASEPPRPEDLARQERQEAAERAHPDPSWARIERKPTVKPKRRRSISEASREQRAAVATRACVVCRIGPCDPAHLLPLGICPDGDGDPRAVVPLCRAHHREYDDGVLDLLPYLEPHWRTELAFAVERFGLLSTLRRVTNERNT